VILHSDNPKYRPFEMPWHEVMEVWEFVAAISFTEDGGAHYSHDLLSKVKALRQEINELADHLVPEYA